MLEEVKKALRITSSAFDSEVENLIEAAKIDLVQAGVDETKVNATMPDAIIKQAIIYYCKAYFGYDNSDAERFENVYTMFKQHLSLYGDYRSFPNET
ncbi:head-tail connector protein [Thermoactinomyces sp. CICC 23799]|jgi:uncharacterized phage protein (predicted DNA packaging)|uniref:head-tail connector protein n=1 Tax=Thermoactinomyces TaxID=2023 RepID=UPI0018DE969D|nr:head-tail connector protein [Thermoactinomyces sp. CICC 23799]MBH8600517.1 phage gp6-like head-tail connector protein [Thermoactinomyces sp. CICC 23799]